MLMFSFKPPCTNLKIYWAFPLGFPDPSLNVKCSSWRWHTMPSELLPPALCRSPVYFPPLFHLDSAPCRLSIRQMCSSCVIAFIHTAILSGRARSLTHTHTHTNRLLKYCANAHQLFGMLEGFSFFFIFSCIDLVSICNDIHATWL